MYEPCVCGADDCPSCFPGRAAHRGVTKIAAIAEEVSRKTDEILRRVPPTP